MRYVFFLISIFASISVMANSSITIFSGSNGSFCTVGEVSQGVLNFPTSNTIGTQTKSVMAVQNNDPGAFQLTISSPVGFDTKPIGYTGSLSASASFESVGSNPVASIDDTQQLTLSNSGNDTLNVMVVGTNSQNLPAGNYQVHAVVTCAAP